MLSRKGQAIRFTEQEVRSMGRSAAGGRGMKLKPGDEVVSCDVVEGGKSILILTDEGFGKRTRLDLFRRIGRGNQGVRGIKLNERKGFVVAAFLADESDEAFLVSSTGVTVRVPVKGISHQGRDATGVRVMNLEKGQHVSSAAPVFTNQVEE
jgi:DNA gyrase subunit A